jgi:hypothetical protein
MNIKMCEYEEQILTVLNSPVASTTIRLHLFFDESFCSVESGSGDDSMGYNHNQKENRKNQNKMHSFVTKANCVTIFCCIQ